MKKKFLMTMLCLLSLLALEVNLFAVAVCATDTTTASDDTPVDNAAPTVEVLENEPVADGDAANETESEDEQPFYGAYEKVGVISNSDLCDNALAELFQGSLVKSELTPLLAEDSTYTPSEAPDIVFILVTENESKDAEGNLLNKSTAKKLMGRVKKGVPEDTRIAMACLVEAGTGNSLSLLYNDLKYIHDHDKSGSYFGTYSYYYKDATEEEKKALALRIAGPLKAEGLYYYEPEESEYNDIVYYIFENGNDDADGKTPETALRTCPGFTKRFKADFNNDVQHFAPGTRVLLHLQGDVENGPAQNLLSVTYKSHTTPMDSEGNFVPIIVDTYNYDNFNKARLIMNFMPVSDGNDRADTSADITLKNLEIRSLANKVGEKTFAINLLWVAGVTLTLDNAEFSSEGEKLWRLMGTENCWSTVFGTPENPIDRDCRLVLKNGIYDATTGVDCVCCGASHYLWSSTGGNLFEAPFMSSNVVVDHGAIVGKLVMAGEMADLMPVKSIETSIINGGTVNCLQTFTYNTPDATGNKIRLTVDGGHIGKYFRGVQTGRVCSDDIIIDIKDSVLYLDTTANETFSTLLGESGSTMNGNLTFNMTRSLLAVACGTNTDSSVYFGGNDMASFTGEATYNISESTFLGVPNDKVTHKSHLLVFGNYGGTTEGTLNVNIKSGLFDWTAITNSESEFAGDAFIFGNFGAPSTAGTFNLTLGEENAAKSRGPAFLQSELYLGGQGFTLSELNETIYGGFYENSVHILPASLEDTVSKVDGNVNVKILGGTFENVITKEAGTEIVGENNFDYSGASIKNINGVLANLLLYIIIGVVVIAAVIVLLVLKKKKKKEVK